MGISRFGYLLIAEKGVGVSFCQPGDREGIGPGCCWWSQGRVYVYRELPRDGGRAWSRQIDQIRSDR